MLFTELTKQAYTLKDLILSDMIYDGDTTQADLNFANHLHTMKHWYAHISWANKKRHLLALVDEIKGALGLSLLLSCIWNCRPKDAVLSVSQSTVYSAFDRVPMDHNRTVQPMSILEGVIKDNHRWFISLDSVKQAMTIMEMLTVSGGPLMCEVLARAQTIYETYRTEQMNNILECIVLSTAEKSYSPKLTQEKEKGKKDQNIKDASGSIAIDVDKPSGLGQAQKELEIHLAEWNVTIKSIQDQLKLEEVNLIHRDGTEKRIWNVNRPKPESIETVDFLQLLPSAIGKRILSYLPRMQLGEYAKVNKYWAYLVEELRGELAARLKINADLEKLKDLVQRNAANIQDSQNIKSLANAHPNSEARTASFSQACLQQITTARRKSNIHSKHTHGWREKNKIAIQMPIRKLDDLSKRLEQRGAADEDIWRWCLNVLKCVKNPATVTLKTEKHNESEVILEELHFPCPLMKLHLNIETPLQHPLVEDPSMTSSMKRNINVKRQEKISRKSSDKHYSLWSRNFTGLYRVVKMPSYLIPNFNLP